MNYWLQVRVSISAYCQPLVNLPCTKDHKTVRQFYSLPCTKDIASRQRFWYQATVRQFNSIPWTKDLPARKGLSFRIDSCSLFIHQRPGFKPMFLMSGYCLKDVCLPCSKHLVSSQEFEVSLKPVNCTVFHIAKTDLAKASLLISENCQTVVVFHTPKSCS